MFTGIIEETGLIANLQKNKNGLRLTLTAKKVLAGTKIGDSIAVNGVCLTVVNLTKTTLAFDVMAVTGADSLTGSLKKGLTVNLERALAANERLGGHFVSGHVDTVGTIKKITKKTNLYEVAVAYNQQYAQYVVRKGSIAIDGISLTVQELDQKSFTVGIIPHTLISTSLNNKKVGDKVNLEFDLLAKYVEKMLNKQPIKSKLNRFALY